MDDRDVAWAAGFFEGEGCMSYSGGYPRLTVANCDLEPLDRFLDVVGGSLCGPYPPPVGDLSRRPKWIVQICGFDRCIEVAAALGPYLGERRRGRIQTALLGAVEADLWPIRDVSNRGVDVAWVTGLFEAEGSVSWSAVPILSLGMADEDVVRWLPPILGGKVYGPYRPRGKDGCNRKQRWHWRLAGWERVGTAVRAMWPLLSSRRRARAIEILVDRIYAKRPGQRTFHVTDLSGDADAT